MPLILSSYDLPIGRYRSASSYQMRPNLTIENTSLWHIIFCMAISVIKDLQGKHEETIMWFITYMCWAYFLNRPEDLFMSLVRFWQDKWIQTFTSTVLGKFCGKEEMLHSVRNGSHTNNENRCKSIVKYLLEITTFLLLADGAWYVLVDRSPQPVLSHKGKKMEVEMPKKIWTII